MYFHVSKQTLGIFDTKCNKSDPTMTPFLLETLDNMGNMDKNRVFYALKTTTFNTEYNVIIEWE